YFRSVYFPIIFLLLAAVVAGYRPGMSASERWDLALLAVFLSALPTFYHFDVVSWNPSGIYWGMVDNFLAGVAALAAAALVRSVKNPSSLKWASATGLLAGLCITIKPSGALIMGIVAGGWLMAHVFR